MTRFQRSLESVDDYIEILRPWLSCYRRALISSCSVKTVEGLALLVGKIELRVVEDEEIRAVQGEVETDHLLLNQVLVGINEAQTETLLRNAFDGAVPISEIILTTLRHTSGAPARRIYPFRHPMLPDGARIPTGVISGVPLFSLITEDADSDTLDWELKAARIPFTSLDEALDYFGLPTLARVGDLTRLDIWSESPAIIHPQSLLDGGVAKLKVLASQSVAPSDFRIGLKIFRHAGNQLKDIERVSVSLETASVKQMSSRRVELELDHRVGDTRLVQAFLSHGSFALHEWYVTDPNRQLNLRHVIHSSIDPELKLLEHLVFESDARQSENFEHGVALLLNLLGFTTAIHGQAYGFSDSADVVAQTPSGRVALVECTIGLPSNKDKLKKLARRVVHLRNALEARGFGYIDVLPIVVTSLTRAEIAADIEDARRLGIVIGCQEELRDAMRQVLLLSNAEQLFDRARNALQTDGEVGSNDRA